MQFTVAFVLAALPLLASAGPFTPKGKGASIPISKRSALNKRSGVVDAAALRAHVARIQK